MTYFLKINSRSPQVKPKLITKYTAIIAETNLCEKVENIKKIAELCANKEYELFNSMPFQITERITSYIIEYAIQTSIKRCASP